MAQFRETPYGVFNYLVNLGDGSEGEVQGGFSEVSGLNAEVTVAEYRAGNAKVNYVKKIPAIHKSGDVTLKRGVVIKLKNEDPTSSSAVVSWKLVNAMPIKWTGPTLTAKGGSDVAIEELVLSVEHIVQS